MLIRNSVSPKWLVILGLIVFFTSCNGKKPRPNKARAGKGRPQAQRPSQRTRGDEDVMVGQVPIKNGTVRLFENANFNAANLSRGATYDEDYEYADGGTYSDYGDADETDRESPSCHSDKNVGGCQRSERERRYYYSRNRGCLRFKGCPGAGGNNYKSFHSCNTECDRGGRYEGIERGDDYYGRGGGYGNDYYGGARASSYRGRGGGRYGYRQPDYGRAYYY